MRITPFAKTRLHRSCENGFWLFKP